MIDWNFYLEIYPDLRANGINTIKKAKRHWIIHGRHENRITHPTQLKVPIDFNWKEYLEINTDLGEITENQAKFHYMCYGKNEARKYKLDLKSFFKNKRVVIVGPSEHVNNGEYIDNFDVVVRCNQGHKLTQLPNKYGSRTDILYHCVSQSDTNGGSLEGINTKFIKFCYPKLLENENTSFQNGTIEDFNKIVFDNRMSIVNKEKYIEFEKELGCRPNCGTVAIWDILQYDIKELYITGFTLFQTEYHELYKKQRVDCANEMMKKVGAHNQELIKKYYQIMVNDYRVNYDEEFAKAVDINKKNDFTINENLKDYIITLLGYTKIKEDGSRHTNWFPWNRFKDVYETIGYKCEWTTLEKLERKDEKRLFVTWNEPTSLELYQSGKVNDKDIVFQKLTSLGKGMNDVNWTNKPKEWCKEWNWPIYQTFEYLYDKGLNIYAFGCKTRYDEFPEKKRICEKLKDRIFWITWGGTPFDYNMIQNAKPTTQNLTEDITFVGSKWGVVGRGNVDSWEKYIEPLENNCEYKFNQYGGIGNKMVSDNEMIDLLKKSKICPIIHAPSWQAEHGIQDRFYTVFLSGRFGICDNLGAIDIFGEEIRDICTEDPEEYHKKSIYYLEHPEKQIKYIEIIQKKIKEKYNFYRQWESIFNRITFEKNIIIFCKPQKGAMGASTVFKHLSSESKIKKIINKRYIFNILKLKIDEIDNYLNTYLNPSDKNIKIHIFYPHQFSRKIKINKKYNQLHYVLIHDLFPLEISDIYMKRNNKDKLSYNIWINDFIENLLTFDNYLILYPSYKMYNLPFKKIIYIKLNHLKQYKTNTKINERTILYPAQCQVRKNIKSLNDTLNYYNLNTKILVSGNDLIPSYDKKQLIELKQNKNKNLEFLNYLEQNKYNDLISKVTGFIYPSIAEGGCLVIQELLLTYKPIAVNNYTNLFLSIIEIIGLKLSEKIQKQIFFTNKYKFEKDCEINKLLKSNFEGIYDKLFILNEICKLYLPNVRVYNSSNLEDTKKSIDWINNFKLKDKDKVKIDNIFKNYKEEVEIINNNLIEPYKININKIINLKKNFTYINNYSKSIDNFRKKYGSFHIYNHLDFHKLKGIKNIFKNERIFIFGNGPSLNKIDLELFKNEYTFCNNKFFTINNKASWKPTFYHFDDLNIINDLYSFCNGDLDKLKSCVFMDNKFLLKFNYKLKNFITKYNSHSKEFINDIQLGPPNEKVINNSIKIALYLGFNEIYLIGCKFNIIYPVIKLKNLKLNEKKYIKCNSNSKILNVIDNNRSLLIIGNGPSTKNLDFSKLKNIDTFMMNASYRKFKDINYYPTYFSCCDSKMIYSHYSNYLECVKKFPIKEFYFTNHILSKIPNIKSYKNVNIVSNDNRTKNSIIETVDIKKPLFSVNDTGGYSTLIGCLKGYKTIYLIGCDLNYTEHINNSVIKTNEKNQEYLEITDTPDFNPNYWFNNYQVKGDIYNIPNGVKMHLPGWENIKKYADFYNIKIFNCSNISKIPYFPFYDLKKII